MAGPESMVELLQSLEKEKVSEETENPIFLQSKAAPSYAMVVASSSSKPDEIEKQILKEDYTRLQQMEKIEIQDQVLYEFDVSEISTIPVIPKFILIGGLLGYGISVQEMKTYISNQWQISGVSVELKKNGIWSFQFCSENEMLSVLNHGVWLVRGRFPLALTQWRHGLNFSWASFAKVPAWVRVVDLEPMFKSDRMLNVIASMIGDPIGLDNSPWASSKDRFIRMLISVGVQDLVKDTLVLKSKDGTLYPVKVQFEWVPFFCHHCSIFGHLDTKCYSAKAHKETVDISETEIVTNVVDASGGIVDPSLNVEPPADSFTPTKEVNLNVEVSGQDKGIDPHLQDQASDSYKTENQVMTKDVNQDDTASIRKKGTDQTGAATEQLRHGRKGAITYQNQLHKHISGTDASDKSKFGAQTRSISKVRTTNKGSNG